MACYLSDPRPRVGPDPLGYRVGEGMEGADVTAEPPDLEVWIDQDLCTGDGLCVQYAPEVFEFDVDGLAYVTDAAGDLKLAPGVRVGVPANLRLAVIDSAKECPGNCIHVSRTADSLEAA